MNTYDKQGAALEVTGFHPDWTMIGTREHAEKELEGFVFRGSGWYIIKHPGVPLSFDTIIVLPYSAAAGEGDRDLYRFYIYNDRNPTEAFNWIANCPVRQDDR
jgi:hypothetical protein